MNKKTMKDNVALDLGITKKDAGLAIDGVVEAFKDGILEDGKVTIVGFGSFRTMARKARTARNPKTGEPVEVPAKMVLKFTPAKSLKDGVASLDLPEGFVEVPVIEESAE